MKWGGELMNRMKFEGVGMKDGERDVVCCVMKKVDVVGED